MTTQHALEQVELGQKLNADAQSLVEELKARTNEIDSTRHLPQDIADRMAAFGFYRLVTPEALGGVGATPRMLCEVC